MFTEVGKPRNFFRVTEVAWTHMIISGPSPCHTPPDHSPTLTAIDAAAFSVAVSDTRSTCNSLSRVRCLQQNSVHVLLIEKLGRYIYLPIFPIVQRRFGNALFFKA